MVAVDVQLALPLRGLYRTDPAWLAAHDDFCRDMEPAETPTGVFMRSVGAAMRMFELETGDVEVLDRVAALLEGGPDAA